MELVKEAKNLQDELIQNRRWLHAHAETGFELSQTVEFVKDKLMKMGYKPLSCGKSVAVNIGQKGKALLLRADMDALKIEEKTALPFASKNGNMHACGHDMHTAILLGVAKLLKMHEKELQYRVKLLFQPAEEILEGAEDVIKAGILSKNTKICIFIIRNSTFLSQFVDIFG